MAINSKQKGCRGERELAKKFREYGYENAKRSQQYCGANGDADIIDALPGIHVECKRTEKLKLYDAVDQAKRDSSGTDDIPVVFHRRNHCEWLAIMPLDDFMNIYREYEASMILKVGEMNG